MARASPSGDGNAGRWKLVTRYDLRQYPCGATAGDRIRLRRELEIRDHTGFPTGEVHPAGEVWTVLPGVVDEPGTVWLRESDGDRHTWDDHSLWDWFERLDSLEGDPIQSPTLEH